MRIDEILYLVVIIKVVPDVGGTDIDVVDIQDLIVILAQFLHSVFNVVPVKIATSDEDEIVSEQILVIPPFIKLHDIVSTQDQNFFIMRIILIQFLKDLIGIRVL